MKRARYILTFVLCTLSLCTWSQDYARLGERTIMGTARYVGFGGAMTAIGADPSAALDNVAGLGLYRRPEAMITFDYAVKSIFMAPHASAVFCLRTDNWTDHGILYHNFMVSYHRVHCFNNSMEGAGTKGHSLGAVFALAEGDLGIPYTMDRYNASHAIQVKERGYTNVYSFDWAMNISHRWYVGLGMRVHSYSFSSEADYVETFKYLNMDLLNYYNRSRTSLVLNGAGCSLATGLIYRPLSWLRLGFGFQTPSFGALTISSSGTFDAQRDSLRWSDAPDIVTTPADFHMPLHISLSVALQVLDYGMLAIQYDYRHQKNEPDIHSLRTGIEIVPVKGLYINAGYVFESPFRKAMPTIDIDQTLYRQDAYFQRPKWQQYISGAVGYRGTRFIVQAAYQYRMRRFNLYEHPLADPYRLSDDTHRIVLSLGWHGR